MTIDSPYKLTPANPIPAPLIAVANCPSAPGPNNPPSTVNPIGWYSAYTWSMYSKFGVQLQGQAINENFTNIQSYNNMNWSFTANGASGASGVYQFTDYYCFANQAPLVKPNTTVPQDPLTTSTVDSATQSCAIGTSTVGGGVLVQTQTLSRYVDHPTVTSIVSPVRSQ